MTEQGQFEKLMADIEETIKDAEGGWRITDNCLEVTTVVSRDPSRSSNGGEYFFYRDFYAEGVGGVHAQGSWSADFDYDQYNNDKSHYDCVITPDGLERMAKMADLTIAARAWLAKEKGCMALLKKAVRSLAD